jgi:hypothetical protein
MATRKAGTAPRKSPTHKPYKAKAPPKPRVFYWKGKTKVKIDPQRSRLMVQVMRHRKGKKLSSAVKRKISVALKKTHTSGRCKSGRPVAKRKPKKTG